jgi:FAD:protein FMN transferase
MATVQSGERTVRSHTEPALPAQRVPDCQAIGWTALCRHVTLLAADPQALPDAANRARLLLGRVERSCDPDDPDGDLYRANQAAGRWVSVNPLLARVVQAAARVAAATSGLIDPDPGCGLPALRHAGSLNRAGSPAGPQSGGRRPAAPYLPEGAIVPQAWKALEVDPEGGLLVPAGTRLDLGGTTRAFAADLVAREVTVSSGTSLVICIGGDIAVGCLPGEQHRWRISVGEHPDEPRHGLAVTVVVTEGALSTSSTAPRRSQPFGSPALPQHDPRTGSPVSTTWRTASVCAATCVDANAASAAALMLGDQAPAWLWQRSLAARLITPSGRVLRIAGWPET